MPDIPLSRSIAAGCRYPHALRHCSARWEIDTHAHMAVRPISLDVDDGATLGLSNEYEILFYLPGYQVDG